MKTHAVTVEKFRVDTIYSPDFCRWDYRVVEWVIPTGRKRWQESEVCTCRSWRQATRIAKFIRASRKSWNS